MLENVADIRMINTPTEVDHYQLFRVIDVYVSPKGEDLGALSSEVNKLIKDTKLPPNTRIEVRGSVVSMHQSFLSFGLGLVLAIVLVYLVLMAQFASFVDPFIILLAIPSGITGVIIFLLITHTTLNVMSLMGLIMMTGIVVSNSILIVDLTRHHSRTDSDGTRLGSWQRTIRAPGAGHYWRPFGFRHCHCLPGARCLSGNPPQGRATA
jgi:multidrug efflux pump subunit AcrB